MEEGIGGGGGAAGGASGLKLQLALSSGAERCCGVASLWVWCMCGCLRVRAANALVHSWWRLAAILQPINDLCLNVWRF